MARDDVAAQIRAIAERIPDAEPGEDEALFVELTRLQERHRELSGLPARRARQVTRVEARGNRRFARISPDGTEQIIRRNEADELVEDLPGGTERVLPESDDHQRGLDALRHEATVRVKRENPSFSDHEVAREAAVPLQKVRAFLRAQPAFQKKSAGPAALLPHGRPLRRCEGRQRRRAAGPTRGRCRGPDAGGGGGDPPPARPRQPDLDPSGPRCRCGEAAGALGLCSACEVRELAHAHAMLRRLRREGGSS